MGTPPKNFAITGVAGFIAPRHLKAIRETGNRVIAATDPHDAVGILDSHFPDAAYFREIEQFEQHLQRLRSQGEAARAHYLSVCSPNYLHQAHIRLGLRAGADVICEKPLVLEPAELDELAALEASAGRRVSSILQLRLHAAIVGLKRELTERPAAPAAGAKRQIVLTYVTSRGGWYLQSWKGEIAKSGGLATNIGIHLFDMLIWLFGAPVSSELHLSEPTRVAGHLGLRDADVRWFLSTDRRDIPAGVKHPSYRLITLDGRELEFSEGFTDLHTDSYRAILRGEGFGVEDVRPAIEVAHRLRHAPVKDPRNARAGSLHPYLEKSLERGPHGSAT